MSEPTSIPPSALLGIMQRTLRELVSYLDRSPGEVDVEACKHHIAPVWGMLDKLAEMQAEALQPQEARAQ